MDYETKIYLEKLVEAVNSPDWWSIGITAVNALIMIWLGWKQHKLQQQQLRLQEQQTKQQDYQLYKTMFQVISDANIEISNFLFTLYVHISNAPK